MHTTVKKMLKNRVLSQFFTWHCIAKLSQEKLGLQSQSKNFAASWFLKTTKCNPEYLSHLDLFRLQINIVIKIPFFPPKKLWPSTPIYSVWANFKFLFKKLWLLPYTLKIWSSKYLRFRFEIIALVIWSKSRKEARRWSSP